MGVIVILIMIFCFFRETSEAGDFTQWSKERAIKEGRHTYMDYYGKDHLVINDIKVFRGYGADRKYWIEINNYSHKWYLNENNEVVRKED